jgi:hypothetical protein
MTPEEIAAMKAENEKTKADLAALKLEHDKLKTPPKKDDPPPPDDKSLAEKAEADRKAKEAQQSESKQLEDALKFNLQSKDFMKNNASLLPSNIQGIFDQAEKENYGSAIQKSNAIKVGVVLEFFAQSSNLDLLTENQKQNLEEFKKLTKDVKEERVKGIYDSIFEPTLESLRKIKKAEALQKGLADPSDVQDAYKKRLIGLSKKFHLGEK